MYQTPKSADGDELTYPEMLAAVEAANDALIDEGRESETFCVVADEEDDSFHVEFEGPGIEEES